MALAGRRARRRMALAGLSGVALCLAALPGSAYAQAAGTTGITKIVFQLDQATPLGAGAALSPDGLILVYREKDGRLYTKNLATGEARPLLVRTPSGMDVLSRPSFSPDGRRILLSASGGTYYSAAEIYRIELDGAGLTRLTHSPAFPEGVESAAGGHPSYARYYYSAEFSPDGSRILADGYDAVSGKDNVAVMAADGSGLRLLAEGRPLAWSSDGQAIYYAREGGVERYDLASRTSKTVPGLSANIVGKVFGKDQFAVYAGGGLAVIEVEEGVGYNMGPLNVPLAQTSARERVDLMSIQWSASGRALLVYEGETTERLEVVVLGGM